MAPKGKKVFVGMSGGVDSSVSAALLKKAGFDVTGVFLKVWHPEFLPCNWREERLDAMRVCAKLEVPFMTIDMEKEYKEEVVDYMIGEYRAGRTPNPDVMCNKYIKFGGFLQKALAAGADFVATGHYAQNIYREDTSLSSGGLFEMRESVDTEKDQTYFLWTLTQKQLAHILFPIDHLQKREVRKLAKKFGLPTAEKKDSQGLCFIGKVDMKAFLSHYIPQKQGRVLNEKGEVVGTHDGAIFLTIGQRHGFTITEKTVADRALYVSAKNVEANTITVSEKESPTASSAGPAHSPLTTLEVAIGKVSWTGQPLESGAECAARIRYRQPLDVCTFSAHPSRKGSYLLHFLTPQVAVSAGQSVVLYKDGACLGGGIIE